MDGDGVTLEELEEYHMVVNKTFRSEEEGFEYYNAYALEKGFNVRKADIKRMPDTNMVFRRLFYCFKEGYRSQKNFNRPNPKRTPKALSRCGCDARLEIELNVESGEWFVKNFVDRHNHRLAKHDESSFLYSHHGLSDAQKADAIEYGIGGLRTHQIMEVMEKQHGGYDKVGFVSRDLYNFVAEYKKKRIQGSDATFLLNYMRAQKDRDADFYFRYSLDSEGHLKNIFWADAQSQLDYVAFGGIVVFDSTYRVNRYNLPFVPFIGINHHRSTTMFGCTVVSDETVASYVWLLETFLLVMRQSHPMLLTGRDPNYLKTTNRSTSTRSNGNYRSTHSTLPSTRSGEGQRSTLEDDARLKFELVPNWYLFEVLSPYQIGTYLGSHLIGTLASIYVKLYEASTFSKSDIFVVLHLLACLNKESLN